MLLFKHVVQKPHQQIGKPYRQGNDRHAVELFEKDGFREHRGQNKSESAHGGRTAFAFVFLYVREYILSRFQLSQDGDKQQTEDERQ